MLSDVACAQLKCVNLPDVLHFFDGVQVTINYLMQWHVHWAVTAASTSDLVVVCSDATA